MYFVFQDNISSPKVKERLHESEARVSQLELISRMEFSRYVDLYILGKKSSAHLGFRVNSVLTRTGCI